MRSNGNSAVCALLFATLCGIAPRDAHAQTNGPLIETIPLGPGVTAQLVQSNCGDGSSLCLAWIASGFTLPGGGGQGVSDFARARHGRIVAATPSGILYTDNRGRRWRNARWSSAMTPLALAFDSRGDFGVAVGTSGAVWTTEDAGVHWANHRDSVGDTLVSVVVLDRVFAMASSAGRVWVSSDGGISVRVVADPTSDGQVGEPVLWVAGGAIWIRATGRLWSVDGDGDLVEEEAP